MADSSPRETLDELRAMVNDYARQQTLDPLKRLGAWAKFGFAGAIFLALGGFLLALGLLRLFQTMEWTEDNLSWVPYLIVFVALIVSAVWCFYAMGKRPDWLEEDNA
ncbi:MAG: hypothetical protein AAF567_07850 [Actinomycetota bacterium]